MRYLYLALMAVSLSVLSWLYGFDRGYDMGYLTALLDAKFGWVNVDKAIDELTNER